MPKISVIMCSYNHSAYVGRAIQSVLDQTYVDFELIIVDDASHDNSVEIIRQFHDPRIKFFQNERNLGISATSNRAIKESSGQYICYANSDDVLMPEKVEKQAEILDSKPDCAMVFTYVGFDVESGVDYDEKSLEAIFEVENKSRYEWLHHFFFKGNALAAPTVMIRRSVLDNYPLDNRLRQQNDFEFYIRVCKDHELYVINEKLTKLTVLADKKNASALRITNIRRICFEYKYTLKHFAKFDLLDDFIKVFPESKEYIKTNNSKLIPFYLAQVIFNRNMGDFDSTYKHVALELIFDLMQSPEAVASLKDDYGFSYTDFFRLTGDYNNLIDPALSDAYKMQTEQTATAENKDKNNIKTIIKKLFG